MDFFSVYKHPITITKLSNFLKENHENHFQSQLRKVLSSHTHSLSHTLYHTWMIDKYLLA